MTTLVLLSCGGEIVLPMFVMLIDKWRIWFSYHMETGLLCRCLLCLLTDDDSHSPIIGRRDSYDDVYYVYWQMTALILLSCGTEIVLTIFIMFIDRWRLSFFFHMETRLFWRCLSCLLADDDSRSAIMWRRDSSDDVRYVYWQLTALVLIHVSCEDEIVLTMFIYVYWQMTTLVLLSCGNEIVLTMFIYVYWQMTTLVLLSCEDEIVLTMFIYVYWQVTTLVHLSCEDEIVLTMFIYVHWQMKTLVLLSCEDEIVLSMFIYVYWQMTTLVLLSCGDEIVLTMFDRSWKSKVVCIHLVIDLVLSLRVPTACRGKKMWLWHSSCIGINIPRFLFSTFLTLSPY